ncbi:MAG: BTAD domain-containing putative transcriptional regulator, partial [Gemmatimonadaceae bacterium]
MAGERRGVRPPRAGADALRVAPRPRRRASRRGHRGPPPQPRRNRHRRSRLHRRACRWGRRSGSDGVPGAFSRGLLCVPEFERWAEGERARFAADYAGALDTLASRAATARDHAAEAAWLRKRAAVDPVDARVTVRLMQALAASGDRGGALQHARVYEALTREELDAPPDPAVVALAARLREVASPSFAPPRSDGALADAGTGATLPSPPAAPRRAVASSRVVRPLALAVLAALAVAAVVGTASYLAGTRRTAAPAAEPETERTTLAVLPFRTITESPEIGFLRVGIADAIITRLANVRQLRVRPTSAILGYQTAPVDAGQAGRALGAQYLVLGTVQEVGDVLRVSAQLVRVSDAAPLWGKHYDLPRADLLSFQDSVARRLETELRIQMSEAERARVYRRYTANAEAYEHYLRGRARLAAHTEVATRAAIGDFTAALRLDPNDALAHAGLAMASAEMHLRFAPDAEVKAWGERAQAEARRGLELDSTIAEVHQALAAVSRKAEFDWARTIAESQRALELSPSLELPHYFIAAAFYHLGLLDLAEREVRAGPDANPAGDRVEVLRTRGVVALLDGRYAEATALFEELRRVSDRALSDTYLAQAYYYTGDTAR